MSQAIYVFVPWGFELKVNWPKMKSSSITSFMSSLDECSYRSNICLIVFVDALNGNKIELCGIDHDKQFISTKCSESKCHSLVHLLFCKTFPNSLALLSNPFSLDSLPSLSSIMFNCAIYLFFAAINPTVFSVLS